MQARRLTGSEHPASPLDLAAWTFGAGRGGSMDLGPQDDAESIAAIRRALELGISWIDTAGGDSRGHSERIIGMACCGIRERSYVFTKCGVLHDGDGDGDGDGRSCLKPGPTRQEIEGILERLEVATLDLVYSHWPLPAEEVEQGGRHSPS